VNSKLKGDVLPKAFSPALRCLFLFGAAGSSPLPDPAECARRRCAAGFTFASEDDALTTKAGLALLRIGFKRWLWFRARMVWLYQDIKDSCLNSLLGWSWPCAITSMTDCTRPLKMGAGTARKASSASSPTITRWSEFWMKAAPRSRFSLF
jgi:hypothetical protein